MDYSDYVNLMGNNICITDKNTKILIDSTNEVRPEVKIKKTKYMLPSRQWNAGQNLGLNIADISFNNVAHLKYLRTTLTIQNCIQVEIKRGLNSDNTCYYSVQILLSSHLLSKNMKIQMYRTIILPVILYGYETWFLTLREGKLSEGV
jgi:hypothetical protein